jgi:hypothetical protein
MPSVERCVARVGSRLGHGFTDEAATRHMHQQFATATIDRRFLIVDPPDEVEVVAASILAAVADGSLLYPQP